MAKQKATEYDFSDILTPKEEYDFSEILAPKVKPDPNSEFSPEKTTPLMLTEYQGLFLPETEAVTATAPRIPVTPGGLSARNRILAEEAYKQHIAEAPPSIKEGGVEQTIAKAPGQISEWVGDPKELPGAIGRGLAEGLTVEIPRMAGQAAQYLGANVQGVNPVIAAAGMAGGHKVQQWAEQAEKAALGERPEYKGLAGVAYEGSKMLAPSIIPAGTAGAAARIGLAGLKSLNAAQKAKIATNIASLTSAGFYGTSTAQDVRARAKEKGVDPGLHPEIQGAIEALGEYVGTRYMAKLLGLDENAIRVTLENFIKTLGVENTTAFVQQLGQSLSDKYSGIRPDARPMDEAIQVIGPTTFMTVMTAGAGKAAEFATRIPEGRRGLPGTTGREFADIPTDTKTEGLDFSDILGAPDRDVVQGEATSDKNVVTPEKKPSESSVEAPQSEELAPEGTQTPPEKETPQIANLEEAKKLTEIETDAGLREADEPLTREQKRALIDAGFTVKELKKMPPKEAKKVLGEEEVATEKPAEEEQADGERVATKPELMTPQEYIDDSLRILDNSPTKGKVDREKFIENRRKAHKELIQTTIEEGGQVYSGYEKDYPELAKSQQREEQKTPAVQEKRTEVESEQKPAWEIAEERVRPYAKNLRNLSDKELRAEDKKISDAINEWARNTPSFLPDGTLNPKIGRDMAYFELSAKLKAIGKEQDQRKGTAPKQPKPTATPKTPKDYIIREEPHPLKKGKSVFRVYEKDGTPLYIGEETAEAVEKKLRSTENVKSVTVERAEPKGGRARQELKYASRPDFQKKFGKAQVVGVDDLARQAGMKLDTFGEPATPEEGKKELTTSPTVLKRKKPVGRTKFHDAEDMGYPLLSRFGRGSISPDWVVDRKTGKIKLAGEFDSIDPYFLDKSNKPKSIPEGGVVYGSLDVDAANEGMDKGELLDRLAKEVDSYYRHKRDIERLKNLTPEEAQELDKQFNNQFSLAQENPSDQQTEDAATRLESIEEKADALEEKGDAYLEGNPEELDAVISEFDSFLNEVAPPKGEQVKTTKSTEAFPFVKGQPREPQLQARIDELHAENEKLERGEQEDMFSGKIAENVSRRKREIATELQRLNKQLPEARAEDARIAKEGKVRQSEMFDAEEMGSKQKEMFDVEGEVKPDALRQLTEEDELNKPNLSAYKSVEELSRDYEILYHGGSKNIIGNKLVTGGRVVGEVTKENLGKGQDYGGIFFTPEKELARTFARHTPAGDEGGVHTFLVKKSNLFDETNPKHRARLRQFIGKKYQNVDGEMEIFTQQMHDFIFPQLEDGRRHMDWATFDPQVLEAIGFDGAKVIENYSEDGKHLYSTVLFRGGQSSPHWLVEHGATLKDVFERGNSILRKIDSGRGSGGISTLLSTLTPEARENVVVTTRDNAPEGLHKFLDNKTKGIYYNGKVYLFENADARTFFHEIRGHYNLRQMFGMRLDPFLDKLWNDRERAIKNAEWYNRYTRTDPDVYNPNTAQGKRNLANEYIAHLSENQDRTTWEKLIAWLRSALRNIAPNLTWTDAELKKLIADGYRKMQKTPQKGTAVQQAPIFQLGRDWYFSAVEESVRGLKQEKWQGTQLLNKLQNTPGVKKEELAWTGLDEFLKGKQSVTRTDVLDYLRENEVRVEEKVLGRPLGLKAKREESGGRWDVVDADGNFITLNKFASRGMAEAWIENYERQTPSGTKFSQYQEPGAKEGTYRELLLTLPGKKPSKFPGLMSNEGQAKLFRSQHYDELNVLAHIRFNEREVDGKRVLFIEEIQSDWHQAGRKRGYSGQTGWKNVTQPNGVETHRYVQPDGKNWILTRKGKTWELTPQFGSGLEPMTFKTKQEAFEFFDVAEFANTVTDAPFKTTWPEMAFRRMVRYAAENGFDAISWTTGEQQAARYDLSKHLDHIDAYKNDNGTYSLYVYDKQNSRVFADEGTDVTPEKMSELIGKDLSERIVREATESNIKHEYSGLDLKVGGEGMKGFYDKILVDYANKFGKKFGSSVGQVTIYLEKPTFKRLAETNFRISSATVHSLPITPSMKQTALDQGFPLFQLKDRKFVAVGIKMGDKVYRGSRGEIHADLLSRMTQDEQFKYLDNTDSHNKLDGFIDDAGQFVSRQEASREAKRELASPDVLRQIEGEDKFSDVQKLPFEEGPPNRDKVARMKRWLSEHSDLYKNEYVIMYHGTGKGVPVESEGLKKTSAARRRSYQSRSGYVYLAATPERARVFGDLGNSSQSKVVAVKVLVRNLKADTDQLNNLRAAGIDVGNTLAESIVYGGGARIAQNIHPYDTEVLRQLSESDSETLARLKPIIEGTGGYNVRVDSQMGRPVVYFEHKGVKDAEGKSVPTTFARFPETVDTPEKINAIVEEKNADYQVLRQLDEDTTEGETPKEKVINTISDFSDKVKAQMLDNRREGIIKRMKTMRENGQKIRRELVDYIKERLPASERGRFLTMVANAKTQRGLVKAFVRVDKVVREYEKRDAIKELRKEVDAAFDSQKIAVDYKQRIKSLLSSIDLKAHSESFVGRVKATRAWLQNEKAKGNDVELPQRVVNQLGILNKKPIREYDTADIRNLTETIRAFRSIGETKLRVQKALYNAEKERKLESLKTGTTPLEKHPLLRAKPGERLTLAERFINTYRKFLNGMQHIDLSITPMDAFFDFMGGAKGTYDSAPYRIFKRTTDRNYDKFLQQKDVLIEGVWREAERLGLDDRNFTRIGVHAARVQKNGMDKLLNSGLTEEEVNAIRLTPQEMEFYRYMRKNLDELRPQIEDVMRNVYNEELGKEEEYFSFMTDWDAMSDSEVFQRFGEKVEEFGHAKKNPEMGFTKRRTGAGGQKIKLDAMEIYTRHIDNASYLIHMARDNRMLYEIANSDEFTEIAGDLGKRIILEWVDTISRKGGRHGDQRMAVLDALRKNIGAATMGFKLSSAIIQPTALMDGAARIGGSVFTGLRAVATSRDIREFIIREMPEVRDRIGDDPAFVEFEHSKNILAKGQRAGLWALRQLDAITASATAWGAYTQKMKELGLEIDLTKPNQKAIEYAQEIVRTTQSTSLFKDVPRALSRGALTGNRSFDRAFFQFQTFMLTRWSLIRHNLYRSGIKGKNPKQAAQIFFWLAMAAVAEMGLRQIAKEAIAALIGAEPPDEDDYVSKTIGYVLQTIPFVSQTVSIAVYGSDLVPALGAVRDFSEGVYRAGNQGMKWLKEGEINEKSLRGGLVDVGQGVTTGLGIPGASQVGQMVRGALREQPKFKEISEMEKRVEKLKAKALETGSQPDIDAYTAAKRVLDDMREASPEYQAKLRVEKDQREARERTLRSGI